MSQVVEDSPLQAAREAAGRNAWHEAFELLRQADADHGLEPDDLTLYGEAAWWAGRLEEALAIRERAYTAQVNAGNKRKAAVLATRLADDHFSKLAVSVAKAWISKADRLLAEEGDCPERGWVTMIQGHAAGMKGDHQGAFEAGEATLDIGTRFGDRDLQAFGLLGKGRALVDMGQVEEGLALLDEATVAAVSGELQPYSTGVIYCVAIHTTSQLSDYGRAGEWAEASMRWCERQASGGFPGMCRIHRAEIMRLRGAWTEAEQEARRALTELGSFNVMFAAEGFYEVGEVRLRMGDLEGAEEAFRQANELGRAPYPGLAFLRLAEGKMESALKAISRAVDEVSEKLWRLRLLPAQVEIAVAAGDLETARKAHAEMEELRTIYDSKVLQAATLQAGGTIHYSEGDYMGAIKNLRQSLRLWQEADLPYEAAKARTLLGVALQSSHEEDEAQFELETAKKAFEKLGAQLDLRRVLELLGEPVSDKLAKASIPTQRVTRTFMFTDIVGSTNLAGVLGDEAWGHLLSWHDDTMRKLFTKHNGEEVKQVGDGFFVAFERPSEAVECAADIQKRLEAHRKETGFAPQVRIGLHCADAARRGRDYEGMGVHEAARIGALAQAGEILASREVVEAALIRFPVSEFRTAELKGVPEPVEIASISVT